MTPRALLIGLALVVAICGFGYFSQHVAGLPSMINGAMPLLVFGTLVVLTLMVNPVLARWSPGAAFSGRELAVIVALGACVCGYTSATYLRYLTGTVAMPLHVAQTEPAWQATEVLAYVPGHVGRVPEGHLRDPVALARRVVEQAGQHGAAGRLWAVADAADRRAWRQASRGELSSAEVAGLVNRALTQPALLDDPPGTNDEQLRQARAWLQAQLPALFVPPPAGSGVLLNDGHADPLLLDGVLFGGDHRESPSLTAVPWSTWWPVIRLWGGLMALLVLSVVCLSVIVRRQWAEHERLAFPLVRFAAMMAHREPGQALPAVANTRMFWAGFAIVLLHLVNGMHAWFPSLPAVPLQLDFSALRDLFPNASRIWQTSGLFEPWLYPTVIAFAFFLPQSISLSFGLATFLHVLIAASLVAYGIGTGDGMRHAPFHELLNFGAMLGLCAVMFYAGRRYYTQVAVHAMLPARLGTTPSSTRWAFRGLVVLLPLSVYHLTSSGLSPMFSALAVAVVLLLWLTTARIVCETGLFRVGSTVVPVGIASALFGFEGTGPTNLIVLTMVGVLLATDLWETPMAYTITGMQLARRTGVRTRAIAPAIAITAIVGLALAWVATLAVQHHFGIVGRFADIELIRATMGIDIAARAAGELAVTGQLNDAVEADDWQRLRDLRFDTWSLGWIGAGVALFTLGSVLRLHLPWWPIHPLIFVLMGNWGLVTFGVSFLLGWALKAGVVSTGGARAYHLLLPFMAGVIAAGLISALAWLLVGLAYFISTGQMPATYGVY